MTYKTLKQNTPLFLGIGISLVLLTLYWLNSPQVIVKDFYDAIDYIDYAYSYNNGPLRFFNNYRAPLYPLFLFLQGFTSTDYPSLGLYITQALLLISNLVMSWSILNKLSGNKNIKAIIIILLALGMDFFWMTKTALSETLTMFFLILSVKLFLNYYKKPNLLRTAVIGASMIALYLTRPFNMYLILPIGLFWIIWTLQTKGIKRTQLVYPLLLIIMIFSSIYIYSYANKLRHNYFGVSIEGGANLFAKVAKNPEWLPENDEEYPELLKRAKTCAPNKIDYFTCQYPLVPHVNPKPEFKGSINWQRDDSYIEQVEKFSKKYIIKTLPYYLKDSVKPTLYSLTELYGVINKNNTNYIYWSGVNKQGPFSSFFNLITLHLQPLHYFFAFVNFLLAPFYFIYQYFISKKPEKYTNELMLVYMVIGYYVLVTGLVAAGDFGRMVTPALPLIYSFSLLIICNTLNKLTKKVC